MTRWLRALVMLIVALASACTGYPTAQVSPPPTSSQQASATGAPSQPPAATAPASAATPAPPSPGCGFNGPGVVLAVAVACVGTPSPQPSDDPTAEYTPYPDPPGTFADCRPYVQGALPTPTPQPDTTSAPTFDAGGLVPCGREEWRQALDPVVRAIGQDKGNFCDSYFPVSEFDRGPWRLVINFVDGGDPAARARVEALIQPDAPVEWRVVDFSWSYLQNKAETELTPFIEKHGITQAAGWGVDVGSDRLFVETRGPQPDLVAALQRQFGDLVVIRVGMG